MTTRNPVTHADIRNVDPRRLLQRRMLSIDTASILPFDARDIIVGQRTATVVTIAEGPYMGFEAAILWANQWNNRDCYTFNFNHNGSQWRDISRLLRHYPTNSNFPVATMECHPLAFVCVDLSRYDGQGYLHTKYRIFQWRPEELDPIKSELPVADIVPGQIMFNNLYIPQTTINPIFGTPMTTSPPRDTIMGCLLAMVYITNPHRGFNALNPRPERGT